MSLKNILFVNKSIFIINNNSLFLFVCVEMYKLQIVHLIGEAVNIKQILQNISTLLYFTIELVD